MTMTVVVEPDPGGHRFQAASFVLQQARRDGEVLLVTSAGATGTEQFRTFLTDGSLETVEVFADAHPDTVTLARELRALVRARGVDRIVVMEGDDHLRRWWFVGRSVARRGRPYVVFFLTRYPARLTLRSGLPYWKVRIAKGVLVLAAMITGTLRRSAGFAGRDDFTRGRLVRRARDPVECSAHSRDRAALRAELGLPAERALVGISGGINARKDPGLVLDAIVAADLDADLVLSGPVSADMHAWLDALPAPLRARVVVDDGFLSNERLDAYIAAVDVVALVMRLEGPSGIQGKALAAATPIVTAGSQTRERELRATHGGESSEPTPAALGAALRRVLDHRGETPAMDAFPVPTGETFAATILGPSR